MRITISLLLPLLLMPDSATGQLTPNDDLRAQLRPFAVRAMETGLTPGLQIAVVAKDGRLWSESFGIADMETDRPVTDTTRFYIASSSKAILALTAALLDEAGRIDLDATLDEAFPEGVDFHPDYDPSSAMVRDLLTHTHGLTPGPLSFRVSYTGQYTNETLFELLHDAAPLETRDFRYSNLGYNLYGLLMAPEQTHGWKAIQRELVLQPLGMEHTTNAPSSLDPFEIAMPHELRAEGLTRVRLTKRDDTIGPAGGHFSTANDLARLLLMEMNLGRLGDEQVFPESLILETQRKQVRQDREIFYYKRHGWGLGWDIGTYDGETVIHRPGGFAGYFSDLSFMPEHGVGIVVLANGGSGGGRLSEAILGAVYDRWRGRADADDRFERRVSQLEAQMQERREQLEAAVAELELLDEPLRPWDSYVGIYDSPVLGEIEIERTADGLRARWGALETDLAPQPREEGEDFEPFFAQLLDENDQLRFYFDDGDEALRVMMRGLPVPMVRKD